MKKKNVFSYMVQLLLLLLYIRGINTNIYISLEVYHIQKETRYNIDLKLELKCNGYICNAYKRIIYVLKYLH